MHMISSNNSLPRNRRNEQSGNGTQSDVFSKKRKKELFFGVLLPSNHPDKGASGAILPAMSLAVSRITKSGGILDGFNITMGYRNTNCSSTLGPLAAFDLYSKRKPGRLR